MGMGQYFSWTDLGLLASAAIFHSRSRHLRPIIPDICLAGDGAFRGDGLALRAHEGKPAAYHAFARSREQHERYRAINSAWGNQQLWIACISGGMDYGDIAMGVCGLLSGKNERKQLAAGNRQLAKSKPLNHEGHEGELVIFYRLRFRGAARLWP